MTRIRKIIGDSLMKGLQEQAPLTTVAEADVTSLTRLRARAEGTFTTREGFQLSPMLDQRGRRNRHLLRHREHRHRGRHGEGADDPGHQGGGRPEHRRHREVDRRSDRQGTERRSCLNGRDRHGDLSLSYDHRLVDGSDAAQYLAVKAIVEAAAFTHELLAESPEQP